MDNALCIFMIADLKRLLEGPHTIGGKPLKVIKQPPKKKVPLDPLKVHVQGLNERDYERLSVVVFREVQQRRRDRGVHGLQQQRNGRF